MPHTGQYKPPPDDTGDLFPGGYKKTYGALRPFIIMSRSVCALPYTCLSEAVMMRKGVLMILLVAAGPVSQCTCMGLELNLNPPLRTVLMNRLENSANSS